eukprot:scaffold11578_cov56-Cylindrotheca_fusiformis.AAC.3
MYFSRAIGEIRQGKKRGHWLWFILPTDPFIVNGKEVGSSMNQYYALRGDEAPQAYLKINYLRSNYFQICKAIETQLKQGNSFDHLFGSYDKGKVTSSWKLFHKTAIQVGDEELASLCQNLLQLVEN